MVWFFAPTCPIDRSDETWLTDRLNWLVSRFGEQYLVERGPVLPVNDASGVPFDGRRQGAEDVFSLVCQRMELEEANVSFGFYHADRRVHRGGYSTQTNFAPGIYRDDWDQCVKVDIGLVNDFHGLVATVAHELSHVKLHRVTEVETRWRDYEQLTDLTAIFFGFGLFQAMVAERDFQPDHRGVQVPTRRIGYLSAAVVCHSLATSAWMQRQAKPTWARHLDRRARAHLKRSLRYLARAKTGALPSGTDELLEIRASAASAHNLQRLLTEAVSREDYEEAARIKKLLDRSGS